jgi:hypothetical protein
MNLRQPEMALVVAEFGSFTKAGEPLHLPTRRFTAGFDYSSVRSAIASSHAPAVVLS